MKKLILLCSAIAISSSALFAQIPNASFETWMTMSSYDMPTGWDQLNAMTSSMSMYTCMKGTPAPVGSSYIKLVSKTMGSMGVMPGITCSGMLDQTVMTNIKPKSGFANTTRPLSLIGSWQYMAYGSDQGYVSVLLSKWNTAMGKRDTVAFVNKALSGMAMSWATFTIPLIYYTGAIPDSAIITLSASGATPVNNSYLYVDNLAFTGSVPAEVVTLAGNSTSVNLFPNPASIYANVSFHSESGKDMTIDISDISGRNVAAMHLKANIGNNIFPLNLSGYTKGIYTVRTTDGQSVQVNQLVIN
jgi:hypothetical protein